MTASAKRYDPEPTSAPGDFYVINGECISCGIPHVVAPDLIAWVSDDMSHCCWKKQPKTDGEMMQAFAIFEAQEAGCHRYAGPTQRSFQELVGTTVITPELWLVIGLAAPVTSQKLSGNE